MGSRTETKWKPSSESTDSSKCVEWSLVHEGEEGTVANIRKIFERNTARRYRLKVSTLREHQSRNL
jgi:hypothetical protein